MFWPLDSKASALKAFTLGSVVGGVALFGALCTTYAHAADREDDSAMQGYREVADLYVVDCLLPGQVRRLGQRTFLTPRRPTRTTAADCEIRGGEYVAYDRADYRSALNVWMPAAETGDAEAQVNVGEIFERGTGGQPNYEAARIWYEKAAAQGNTRAQFNLGTLYEQGLGVPRDQVTALNWYRKAWGIQADDVIFASAAAREQEALRAELARAVAEKDAQIDLLNKRLEELRNKLEASSQASTEAQSEVQMLNGLIEQLKTQRDDSASKLGAMPAAVAAAPAAPTAAGTETSPPTSTPPAEGELRTRQPIALQPANSVQQAEAEMRSYSGLSLGRYYALLIGNQNYSSIESLTTPLSDLERARKILEERYGFTVFTVADGDNIAIMKAINDLYDVVGEEDNLLLFYAGHGNRLTTGGAEIGYWLPANAEAPPRNTFWVANEFVTGHLSRIRAKRVLVVADSCYAGLLSAEPSFLMVGDSGPQYSNMEFLKFKLGKRSRLLLSSGGDQPVLDEGGGQHSVFAKAFLDELEKNDRLLPSPELFLRLRDQVEERAAAIKFEQTPEFKTIKSAGHEVGDFFFVPVATR
ncbi:MAG: hypothetical protein RL756_2845 [Pseudomonadota bacterium]